MIFRQIKIRDSHNQPSEANLAGLQYDQINFSLIQILKWLGERNMDLLQVDLWDQEQLE